ncbi:hypothetical protein BHE74_00030459 [Ensete ventricosum]|nr:hypothetical protein GW17_00012922 [Ensete ventricosum]RWW62419.1 hypothetical protein BHE74_00030459 [Ensete ventricosum]RZR96510.1 hypothetical protein BHM03_00025546 [Ensete ventricosum]
MIYIDFEKKVQILREEVGSDFTLTLPQEELILTDLYTKKLNHNRLPDLEGATSNQICLFVIRLEKEQKQPHTSFWSHRSLNNTGSPVDAAKTLTSRRASQVLASAEVKGEGFADAARRTVSGRRRGRDGAERSAKETEGFPRGGEERGDKRGRDNASDRGERIAITDHLEEEVKEEKDKP